MRLLTYVTAGLLAVVIGSSAGVVTVGAARNAMTPCDIDSGSSLCKDFNDPNKNNEDKLISNIIETLLFIVGAVSVIVIIIAGIRYTTSGGSQQAVEGAKKMIIGGVAGLVIAIFAYAIVKWVVFRMF